MPRLFLKKYIPSKDKIIQNRWIRYFGIERPSIWRFNRHSCARAVGVGLFCALLPIPLQMLPATILAILLQANLPIAIALVWITNPLTMPVVLFVNYKIGAFLLNIHAEAPALDTQSLHIIWEKFTSIGLPLMTGSLFTGVVCAVLGYIITQRLWIASVRRSQQRRPRGSLNRQPNR